MEQLGRGYGSHGTTRWLSSFSLPLALPGLDQHGGCGAGVGEGCPFPRGFQGKGFYLIPWLGLLDPRPSFEEAHSGI